jgi:hypothetical protein
MWWLTALVSVGLCSGCGNSPSSSSPPDFAFSANVASLSLTAGGATQVVGLSAAALNGFSGTINVTVSGLPAGVTVSPSTLSLTPGMLQQIGLTASASAPTSTVAVQFIATSGMLSHTAPVAVSVNAAVAGVGVDVVTYHDDVARTGLNANETILTPGNVNSSRFGLLRILPADGKVDGQPLVLSGLTIGGIQRNVVYAVTEHDSVYAFDADCGTLLWKA